MKHIPVLCLFMFTCALGFAATNAMSADVAQKPDVNQIYFTETSSKAATGDRDAQECLGELYGDGFGTTQDSALSLKWYKTAADAGDLLAKVRIGQSYEWGVGVEKDPEKAKEIFEDLMKAGFSRAATELGLMYVTGTGVPLDYKKATDLYQQAADAGDYEAQMRLGLLYHSGNEGLAKDESKARFWLEKAAHHKIDCFVRFGILTNFIISGYMKPLDETKGSPTGTLRIQYTYHDGRAENVVVLRSSGRQDFDQAWLDATKAAKLPPWPSSFHESDMSLGFMIPGQDGRLDADFINGLRSAIQAAKVTPKEVLLRGSKGKGIVQVGFDYLDGKASNVTVASSSDDAYEDAAAVKAVTDAAFPATPARYAHMKIHMSVGVRFEDVTPADSAITSKAPAAVSGKE